MADNETIADIIAEMRGIRVREFQDYADRFEAAHRRERGDAAKLREADHNWDAICEKCSEGEPPDECRYYGEPSGCNSPMYGEHPKPFGENAAVLRSAIIEILSEMEDMAGLEVGRKYKFSPDAMVQQCRDALSAPPRNCDRFATAEEAAKAWHKHEANDTGEKYCAECPFNLGEDCARGSVCTIGWLYAEAQEGGAK